MGGRTAQSVPRVVDNNIKHPSGRCRLPACACVHIALKRYDHVYIPLTIDLAQILWLRDLIWEIFEQIERLSFSVIVHTCKQNNND